MHIATYCRFRVPAAAFVATAVTVTACNSDRMLNVDRPDIVPISAITDKSSLPTVRGGVLSDFQVGFSGSSGNEGVAQYSALLGDEFTITETFPTRIQIDARNTTPDNSNNDNVFRTLSRSRQSAEQAAAKFAELAPTFLPGEVNGFNGQRAETFNIAGMDYLLFAEIYCSGVPFDSVTKEGGIIGKPGLTTTEMLRTAINRFDSATAVASTVSPASAQATAMLRMARVGKARAYLGLANSYGDAFLDSAAATLNGTTGVPTSFVYLVSHSNNTSGEVNGIWSFNSNQGRWGESNREGTNGLPYRSQFVNGADVRTAFTGPFAGFDNRSVFLTQKYPARETPVVVASGIEARLIEAEVFLRKGEIANWLLRLNGLRQTLSFNQCVPVSTGCTNPTTAGGVETSSATHTTATGLADLVDPGTQVARENLHFAERGFWLYVTAHRLGDMRRLIRQFGRTALSVFPIGPYVKPGQPGGIYGPDVSLPVPIFEQANGIFTSCDKTIP